MSWFSFMWNNGNRNVAIMSLTAAAAFLILLSSVIFAVSLALWPGNGPAAPPVVTPLVVTTPFIVLSEEVPQGGSLRYLNNTCNTTSEPLDVTFESSWVRGDGDVLIVPGGSGVYTNGLGCHYNEAIIPIPPEVVPGTWYRAGMVDFVYAGEYYSVAYRTESFEVVP